MPDHSLPEGLHLELELILDRKMLSPASTTASEMLTERFFTNRRPVLNTFYNQMPPSTDNTAGNEISNQGAGHTIDTVSNMKLSFKLSVQPLNPCRNHCTLTRLILPSLLTILFITDVPYRFPENMPS
jgi:hypothetical protein